MKAGWNNPTDCVWLHLYAYVVDCGVIVGVDVSVGDIIYKYIYYLLHSTTSTPPLFL